MGLLRKKEQGTAVDRAVTGAELSRFHFVFAFTLVSSLFFVWGLSYGLLDSLNKAFQVSLNLTRAESTGLQAAYFGSYLINGFVSGSAMRKYGYKNGIHFGLALFSIGAVLFWPCAIYKSFPGFIVCTFVTASGLAWLEVAANSYITVIGAPNMAAFRLVFAQSFNGVATVIGPIIASHTFLKTDAKDLNHIQWVYLGIALFGCLINFLFLVCPLPEVKQEVNEAIESKVKGGLFKQYHLIAGAVTEFMYVGAQVAVASLAINYFTEQPDISISTSAAANLYAGCQAAFTLGRFLLVPVLFYVDSGLILGLFGVMCVVFSCLTAGLSSYGGIVSLFCLFFFEGVCYPIIFTLATSNLGSYQKIGSALVAAGVSGGAAWPSVQAVVADNTSTPNSYHIPIIGFAIVAMYGFGMNMHASKQLGRWAWRKPANEEIKNVIAAVPDSNHYGDAEHARHGYGDEVDGDKGSHDGKGGYPVVSYTS
ncbi:uncharacterized protein PFL1_01792 [Pseudozyma flocculosa PF-1]|uniref:Related to glucose/galactose transporter n=1 Tax=Pseudozyma flocculosa TaxID=84751 RepID=A0A5C3EY82_9BASI|nr:uncharacterized protein PFL1_01792 [Pseudozyma flocculosa PF-1]EPQ30895.1 hypothetical protein PFL1_01792 [Pseudozyma flocculosa PF-1]SPO36725.1 related to glucose/galactose transporter [Pseudozyma flocculosa]